MVHPSLRAKKKDFARSHIEKNTSPTLRSPIKDYKPHTKYSVSPSRGHQRGATGSIRRKSIKGPVTQSKNSNLDSRNSAPGSSVSPSGSKGWRTISRNHRQIYASE